MIYIYLMWKQEEVRYLEILFSYYDLVIVIEMRQCYDVPFSFGSTAASACIYSWLCFASMILPLSVGF